MKGFIGVTSNEWFRFLESSHEFSEINFWRKNKNSFKALSKGDPFFFLVKNDRNSKGEREVCGKASFLRFEVLSISEAWIKYGKANGDPDKNSFEKRMNKMFDVKREYEKIGCIILSNFQPFIHPVKLSDVDIEFHNSIVSGRSITVDEIDRLNKAGNRNISSLVNELIEINSIGLTEDDDSFPEGKQVLKKHLLRERNSEVIRRAKERYIKRHGLLECQICGFNFVDIYGEIGSGYIEGHHTTPISEMNANRKTKIDDIVLVCSNCHRMLHRKRPWLSIDDLKEILHH